MDAQLQPLSSFCDSVDYGLTASASTTAVGPKFVRITDIVGEGIDWTSVPSVECSVEDASKYRLHHGDVVIARTGATTGCSAYIKNPPEAVFASYLVRLRVSEENDPRYVAYALQSSFFWEWIHSVMDEKAAQPNASASTMAKALLPKPAKSKQAEIARILGALDDKIELNRRMCATLEEMARAIFRSWFVDFDPVRAKVAAIAEGRDPERAAMAAISGKKEEDLDTLPAETLASLRATAALFPSSFTDSDLGEIPEGWSIGNFGDIAVLRRRNASVASIDPNEPYVGLEHFTRASLGLFDWGVGRGLESQKFRFEKGEVLFGKLRPYFHKVCIAPVAGVCSTDILVVSPINAPWTSYVRLLASEPSMIDHATALSDGTRMPRASWGDLAIFPMAKPPQELALAFDRAAGPMLETLTLLPHESRTLAALRDTLLPKLLSGEFTVNA